MKVELILENIEGFLPILTRTIPIHSQIPVLANLLIQAESDGIYISATNLELGVRIRIPAKIEEKGATTVPGKQFIEAIASLPKDKITISVEKETLLVNCRNNRLAFQTIESEEFPTLFEKKGEKTHEFTPLEIKDILTKTIFAVSQDDSRAGLTGILFFQKKDGVDFVATDGFRLSLKRMKKKTGTKEEEKLILPARLVSEVLNLKTDKKINMYVYKKANQVMFETENTSLVGRLISGEFPNYEKVIPEATKTKITVDTEEFLQKIRLSSVFARESANIVKIKIEDGKIKIHSRASGVGEGEVEIEGKQEGEDNEIAFNVKFLSDLLRNVQAKTISLSVSSAIEPSVFKTEEDEDFLHIIMPVRVQE